MSVRALLGWTPTWEFRPLEGGGWQARPLESEWDTTERNLALALDEVESHACKGCGGDLTVELTDKHPMEDDGDGHYHQGKFLWCRECVSRQKILRTVEKADQELEGTAADNFPAARFISVQRLPIPTDT